MKCLLKNGWHIVIFLVLLFIGVGLVNGKVRAQSCTGQYKCYVYDQANPGDCLGFVNKNCILNANKSACWTDPTCCAHGGPGCTYYPGGSDPPPGVTPPPSCTVGPWVGGACGGVCQPWQRLYTRFVSPAGCADNSYCGYDLACCTDPGEATVTCGTPTVYGSITLNITLPAGYPSGQPVYVWTDCLGSGNYFDFPVTITSLACGQQCRFEIGTYDYCGQLYHIDWNNFQPTLTCYAPPCRNCSVVVPTPQTVQGQTTRINFSGTSTFVGEKMVVYTNLHRNFIAIL